LFLWSIAKDDKLNPRRVLRDLRVTRQNYFPYDDLQDFLRLRIWSAWNVSTYPSVLGNIWFIHSLDCSCDLPCSLYHSSLTSKIFQSLCTPSPESDRPLCGAAGGRLMHQCATFWKMACLKVCLRLLLAPMVPRSPHFFATHCISYLLR